MRKATGDHDDLNGVRVLLVEDDPVLLMDLELMLAEAGAVVVGLCQTLDDALVRSDTVDFTVAVLDYRLGAQTVSPLARRLLRNGVPFILYTGQGRGDGSIGELSQCPIVEKPATSRTLISALRAVLDARYPARRSAGRSEDR